MISPDQAKKAAESILEPSRQELDARKEKIARMKEEEAVRTTRRRESPAIPALFAAIAALLTVEFSSDFTISMVVGTLMGWAVGKLLRLSPDPVVD
jgi:glyoxylate carboligase